MSLAPIPQDPNTPENWKDDPAISDVDHLIRYVMTGWHVAPRDDGTWEISPKVFATSKGVSVELLRLFPVGTTIKTRHDVLSAMGALKILAGEVRKVPTAYKGQGEPKGSDRMKICYTPDQSPRNELHCDLFTKPSKLSQEALLRASAVEIGLDEAEAASRYANRLA